MNHLNSVLLEGVLVDNPKLIPLVDPPNGIRLVKFDVAINHLKKNTVDHYFTMEISTDYNGDVSQATWTKVEGIQWPAGDSWTFYTIEGADISSFAGQKVYIAFHYKSDKDTALTVEIQNLSVQE